MNKEYKIKLDLNKKIYNKKMTFNQFDENVNDFYIEVTKNNEVVKDLDKSIVTLVAIKPNGTVDAQFIEVKEGQIYADLKPSMCDLVGNYQAKAMIVLEGEIVTTDTIIYSVNEDKIISRLNEDVVSDERFTLFTDALARLSDIEASEEQRIVNEAERILSEENRKIEEAKRVEAELIRQHEEADRTKYDAIRESNENIRKRNESIRLANETNRIDEEAKRVEEENKRKLAEEERNANYNFMTEDEERRRSEANAHKEAENLRVQAETNRVNEEAKRRTTEQARVSAENTRVSNENTRETNEETRQSNEAKRVEAETQRQSRYNSFIVDAEANANNFENYTNNAKVNEEERKANELERKSQEVQRVSNENERISNENSRKANEVVREENEISRQGIFEDKVDEFNEKIVELNTTKENFVSSINTKVDNKISEIDKSKTDMTTTVSNKIDEVETRFNALTSKQQQDAEVIDARDGETSLKARLDRDIEKAKEIYVNVEGSNISTDSSVGYLNGVEILGNTIQDASNLADIRSVGDKVEGQELYEIPVVSRGKNLTNLNLSVGMIGGSDGVFNPTYNSYHSNLKYDKVLENNTYTVSSDNIVDTLFYYDEGMQYISNLSVNSVKRTFETPANCRYIRYRFLADRLPKWVQIEEGTQATPYEPYVEDKLTILSPTPLEKVGDVSDRIIEKDGVWGVEKNVGSVILEGKDTDKISFTSEVLETSYSTVYNLINIRLLDAINIHTDAMTEIILDRPMTSINNRRTQGYDYNFCVINGTDGILRLQLLLPKTIGTTGLAHQWLNNNNVFVKYQLKIPQFIPLPHDQQVKLRTFANKTNISFGCEIEGTIKAQVPKSLGATVNTHTEQISNLNKELDRVKKLEESTVSTIETESDFTTVEATNGGYFEDVKLEGKTLVNLNNFNSSWGVGTNGVNGVDYSVTSSDKKGIVIDKKTDTIGYIYARKTIDVNLFKPNTTYTIVCNVNNIDKLALMSGNAQEKITDYSRVSSGYNCFKVTSTDFSTITGIYEMFIYCAIPTALISDSCSISDVIILEGDHTQNPPSFFEGLASVGDGVGEVSVLSVDDGNLFDGELELGSYNNNDGTKVNSTSVIRSKNYIPTYGMRYLNIIGNEKPSDGQYRMFKYDENKNYLGTFLASKTEGFELESNVSYITFHNNTNGNLDLNIIINSTREDFSDCVKSDKKRLLYYNNETQAWEKPILRQWDSIEKHADGKYYYHQRSGEVVLNGSENWGINPKEADILQGLLTVSNIDTLIISDKFKYSQHNDIDECIWVYNKSSIVLNINKSKLSTQDVQGLKQWLQTNNVTVVYQLAQEKVYECTNIDLITYSGETNYVVECGAIVPKSTLKVHNNISNVVSLLQKKVSLLESNVKASQEVQDMMILETDMRMLDIELALMEFIPMKLNLLGGSDMLRSTTYFNFLKNHIINETYEKEYLENVMNKYLATGRINQDEYDELYKMLYPPVYDIELPIEY